MYANQSSEAIMQHDLKRNPPDGNLTVQLAGILQVSADEISFLCRLTKGNQRIQFRMVNASPSMAS